MRGFVEIVAAIALVAAIPVSAKDRTPKDFDNKYFVVIRPGLAVGTCDIPCSGDDDWCNGKLLPTLAVRVDGSDVEFHPQSGFAVCDQSGGLIPTPIAPGTILLSTTSSIDKHEGRYCLLLQTALPISVTRGIGAFAHPSEELGAMSIRIRLSDPTNVDLIGTALRQWLTQADSLVAAVGLSAQLEHSEAQAAVKQIKVGMTFQDVEGAMGLPDTRVDLGHKVLYKYPSMTVVFEDGKVSDVQ
jgi:hypothetical protein